MHSTYIKVEYYMLIQCNTQAVNETDSMYNVILYMRIEKQLN